MKFNYKKFSAWFVYFFLILNIEGHAKNHPSSFADLADELMPSVVNISTTQTIKTQANPFPFQFPPGSPFGEMFKEFDKPTERKATSLGSGFIIKKDGTVITNNHVIANAEDIIVRVNNKEYQAKVVGADPYSDIAVLKIETSDTFKIVLDESYSGDKFRFVFKTENMKMIPGNYDVEISSKGISHFSLQGQKLQYWIATESSSSFGG